MRDKIVNLGRIIMDSSDLIRLEDKYGATNYKPLDVVLTKEKIEWAFENIEQAFA